MDQIVLPSKLLVLLHSLQARGAVRPSEYDGSDLDALFRLRFIQDVHPGRIALTQRGEDYLMLLMDGTSLAPPARAEEASAPPTAADLPAKVRRPMPAANGVLAPKTLLGLIALARAGGEIRRADLHHFTVDKLLLEGLIEESGAGRIALTALGVMRLEQEDARRAAVSEPATAGNTPPKTMRRHTPRRPSCRLYKSSRKRCATTAGIVPTAHTSASCKC